LKVYVRKQDRQARIFRFLPLSEQAQGTSRTWREAVAAARNILFGRIPRILRTVLVLVGITSAAFGLGYGAGKVLHDPQAAALAHASGACIALEMAAAHGAIDEVERHMTVRALASALNPHFELFPERASEIATECTKLTNGAMRGFFAR
jgi:hypothetical protein